LQNISNRNNNYISQWKICYSWSKMSGRCEQNISHDACTHLETIEDDRTGDCVCILCGLVVGQLFYTAFEEKKNVLQDVNNFKDVNNFIQDVCANCNISRNVADISFQHFQKLKSSITKKISNFHLATYAIYDILNQWGIPRPPEEICFYTGTRVNKLFAIKSLIKFSTTTNNPKDYVSRFRSSLGLTYTDAKNIDIIIDEISELLGNLKSTSLVAIAMYLYVKLRKLNITLKKICENCQVSPTSVHRALRSINVSDREKIGKMF
jgi:transcription initiation factor TFIIIB Brf1 subunit/transcription initiation factor TFIIB